MQTPRREIELDFLRGIAILVVLDFHFAPRLEYLGRASVLFYPLQWIGIPHFGWAGVDIFFVLSGFLVGGLLIKERLTHGRIAPGRFLIRRAFKIWPQYYFFLAVIVALHPHWFGTLRGNLLNIQNYTGTPLEHTWSLAVEEHFYLLLIVILVLAVATHLRTRTLSIVLAIMAAAVTVHRVISIYRGNQGLYLTHMRIDALLFGVLLALAYHHRPELFTRLQRPRWLLPLVPAVAILSTHFQSPLAVSLGIFAADLSGVALLLLCYRHCPHKGPVYRFVAWIGLYSYGIYLWHESVLGPTSKIAAHLPHTAGAVFLSIAPWIFAIGLGVLTTNLIESPSLRLRDRLFPRRVDSAAGTPAISEVHTPTTN